MEDIGESLDEVVVEPCCGVLKAEIMGYEFYTSSNPEDKDTAMCINPDLKLVDGHRAIVWYCDGSSNKGYVVDKDGNANWAHPLLDGISNACSNSAWRISLELGSGIFVEKRRGYATWMDAFKDTRSIMELTVVEKED